MKQTRIAFDRKCSFIMKNEQHNPASNYMLKVNNRNTRTRYGLCLMLTIKTPERRNGVVLVSLLSLTLNIVTQEQLTVETKEYPLENLCDVLHYFVPFVIFKLNEKHPQRIDTFSTKGITPPWLFFRFFKLYKWYQTAQSVS